jgi:hypothetical protein
VEVLGLQNHKKERKGDELEEVREEEQQRTILVAIIRAPEFHSTDIMI